MIPAARAPALALTAFVVIVCAALAGCTGTLHGRSATPSDACIGLDNTHRTWGAIAKFSGVIAGGGGLATLPIDTDQKTARITVATSALVLGGISAAAVYIEQDAAGAYAKECVK